MTNLNSTLNNFNSGELSPKVYGRFDLAAYFNGLRRMENFIGQTQGGAIFRGGFHFVAVTKGGTKAFLHKFQFSNVQSYMLEFTDTNIRIYKDRGIIAGPIDVTTPYLLAELFELKFAQNAQDLYIVHPNHKPRKLTRTSDTAWTLTVHTPAGVLPSFSPQKITEVTQANPAVVTFLNQDITAVTKANPAVVTYSGADNYANGDLIRISGIVGMIELNDRSFTVGNVNTGGNTFELVDIDSTAFTAYVSDGVAGVDAIFVNGDVILIEGVVGMTELNDTTPTIANVNLSAGTFELSGVDSTGFGVYVSDGTATQQNNNPSAVGIYEQRLIYGGSIASPETLWFSVSADFDDFTIGTGATDGLKYTVAVGEDANNIEWIKGTEDFLTIGGIGDILRATGGEGQEAITPTSISIKPTNTFGVADINPIGKKQSLIYMQRNNRTLLSFEKDELGIYKPTDNNIASDHITISGVTQIAYQEGRPDVTWAVKNNGDLIGMTINRRQQVSGWHRHSTTGDFISITTTPRDGDFDTLWVCVKRTVNGSETHHIEYLNDNPDFPRREDFVTGAANKIVDGEKFQRALFEAQKLYIHVDNAATFNGAQRAIDAGSILTIGAVTGTGVNFTASAAIFAAGDVDNEIWIKSTDGSRFGRAVITVFNSTTSVDCDIFLDFDATDVYPAGEWYITAKVITGLDNNEGLTVTVQTDGSTHPDRTVASNQITLDSEASVVHVGLGYIGTLETMDLEGGGTTGTAQTKQKSVFKAGLRLLDTSGLEIGTDYYNLKSRVLRAAVDLMDNPPPLFTGDEVVRFDDGTDANDAGWSRSKRVIVQQSLPLPATLQLVTPYFTVSN